MDCAGIKPDFPQLSPSLPPGSLHASNRLFNCGRHSSTDGIVRPERHSPTFAMHVVLGRLASAFERRLVRRAMADRDNAHRSHGGRETQQRAERIKIVSARNACCQPFVDRVEDAMIGLKLGFVAEAHNTEDGADEQELSPLPGAVGDELYERGEDGHTIAGQNDHGQFL
jgi:hypothetical protein